jgi:diacylglycerol kinase (ATP)
MQQQKFSIRSRARSFYYAFAGIRRFLLQEHNARIHLAATFCVAVVAWALRASGGECAILAAAVGLVWVAEIFNTCLERLCDLVSTERNPDIKFIKDLAAGAVLVASVIAVIIGLFIFLPRII